MSGGAVNGHAVNHGPANHGPANHGPANDSPANDASERRPRTVLAVDGGNSKTDVALVSEDGTVHLVARGGAFLPHRAGVTAAIDVIDEVVRRTMPGQVVGHIAAYVAGADLPVEEVRLREELLDRGLASSVVVGNDTFALLRAGTTGTWGVAVVCGAGINAVGVSPTGEVARFPALGRISGDWGGGLGLGGEVLWHAARAEDGRGPDTVLVDVVRDCFGTATVEDAVIGLHFEELRAERLLDLVPPLFAAASGSAGDLADTRNGGGSGSSGGVGHGGDAIARSLVERLADEVAVLGTVAMRRIDLLDMPCEVVLGGGVLTARHPLLMSLIEERYAAAAPQAKLVVVDVPPIVGAALLGLDHLGAAREALDRVRGHFLGLHAQAL